MSKLTLEQAVAQADLLVDRPTIDAAIAGIADAIARDYKGEVPVFLSIMNGALPFAGQLALELGARGQDAQFDYMQASRYHGESGGELVWKHRPVSSLFGRRVLLVDDILDEGFTLQGVRDWCLEQGATDVRIAVLTVKQHDRCLDGVTADYAGIELPDRFVFGFGMDVSESLRSLPAIYAMKQ
ncbi:MULTISPECIES: hypoxanthine-guanine phosphoribosyltransferase [Stenotrophomonas]|uniref:Hypoxanthine-guanine phosphoribosyltransferase n=1 Tax=Stenotrophomonas nitritireducens TaxID=83617 RepID=A0A9D8KWG4_9GAMM|nr:MULTISPECIES: hypoxanthine-guanine phosphoribosyltransferase [Stenotrophomonas]KQN99503.1 hypoxanthine-guanine phosphoribosyltransferase [Stenotrophomonas sp. Leaf70]KRG56246.1 hypoxanthine-guanine phosphoribosyltransferase [Stenotrophomonas nitritireducens]MBN8790886.1 hypoxanthine-guanine phosphoribosyltransferase [Stenotrophomonas nitritireducens]MBN8796724.1 hypoxanthine-guanine phosphoribosyltransferase [Stenotrophomonas nitritireducens]MBN8798053.1 hypoxanthine-guanine phosphoribosylt